VYAPHRFVHPERQAGAVKDVQWVEETTQGLSADDQSVLQAVVDVELGERDSLGEALGVTEAAARKRKERLRERLAAAAVTEGNRELARHLGGRKYADGLELLHVAKPEDAHCMQELKLYREGELTTFDKVALEKHLQGCPGCRRTLRAMTPRDPSEDEERKPAAPRPRAKAERRDPPSDPPPEDKRESRAASPVRGRTEIDLCHGTKRYLGVACPGCKVCGEGGG
jgi:hypothetical protein